MDDIVPELYKKIKSEFDGLVSSDEEIQAILNDEKDGTFAELYPMSKRVGQYAAKSLSNHYTEELLPDGILYWNIMERTIMPIMKNVHKIDNQLAFNVQKKLDAAQKIGIKPQESDFPEDRVNSVMNMLSTLTQDDKTDLQRASQVVTRSIVNVSNSIIDNFIQKNAEFRENAGMTAKIIRTSSGHCCEWCNEIAGTYKYPDVPKDVYRRHDNCDCTVEYVCGKVKNIVHSGTEGKRKYVQDEYGNYKLTKEARIAKYKQMAATEEERKKIARDKRIETWARKKNNAMYCYGDHLRDVLGSAIENNKEELNIIIDKVKEMGGEFIILNNGDMVTNVFKGRPGIIQIDKNASIAAIRHEFRHFCDDIDNGCPGLAYYLQHKDEFFLYELRGYQEELDIARKLGYTEIEEKIKQEIEARRKEIYGE